MFFARLISLNATVSNHWCIKRTNKNNSGSSLVGGLTSLLILLLLLISNIAVSQESDSIQTDTVAVDFETQVEYNARDSMIFDVPKQKVYLYGNAHVTYGEIDLDADYIAFDFGTKTALAKYTLDSLGNPVGKPLFKEKGDEFEMDSILYNFETKKGIIYNVRTEQAEGFLTSEVVKKQPNNHIHISRGRYTTCDLDDPHYFFRLSKAVVIPDDKIVSGPLNLWIADIPTPLGLPFGYFPNKKGGTNGLVLPEFGNSPQLGYYLLGIGYYHHFGNKFDTQMTADIYSRGSWGIRNRSRYKKRYRFNGNMDLQFTQLRVSEPEFPDFSKSNEFFVRWNHNQDPKARPGSRFSANVNVGSINNFQNNFNTVGQDYLSNTFNSNIRWNKTFENSPFSVGLNLRHSQNTLTEIVNVTLPEANINQTRIYPFRKVKAGKSKFLRDLTRNTGFSQSANIKNDINDSAKYFSFNNLDYLTNNMRSGMRHNANLNTSVKMGPFTLNPAARYTGRYYLETIIKSSDSSDILVTDTIPTFNSAHEASFSAGLTTKLYGMYGFSGFLRGKREAEIRHVLTPNLNFTYTPKMNSNLEVYAQSNPDSLIATYSPFEQGIFGRPSTNESGILSLSLINTLDMKLWAQNDTTDIDKRKKKKVKIIENATVSGSYNLMADSLNLSLITVAGRTRLFKDLSLNFRTAVDPYHYEEGRRINSFEVGQSGRLGTITSSNLALSYNLRSKKKSGKKNLTNVTEEELDQAEAFSEYFVDYTIPWQLNTSYNITANRSNINTEDDTLIISQTIRMGGDIGLTEKWRIGVNTGFDFRAKDFNYTTITIYRDMHCWEGQFIWIPFGNRRSFTLTVNVKAALLKDLRLQRRRAWFDNSFGS